MEHNVRVAWSLLTGLLDLLSLSHDADSAFLSQCYWSHVCYCNVDRQGKQERKKEKNKRRANPPGGAGLQAPHSKTARQHPPPTTRASTQTPQADRHRIPVPGSHRTPAGPESTYKVTRDMRPQPMDLIRFIQLVFRGADVLCRLKWSSSKFL